MSPQTSVQSGGRPPSLGLSPMQPHSPRQSLDLSAQVPVPQPTLPSSLSSLVTPSVAQAQVNAEIQAITTGDNRTFFATQTNTGGGNTYFHPLNPQTGLLSRFPHISQTQSGETHVTDIAQGRVLSYLVNAQTSKADSTLLNKNRKKKIPSDTQMVDQHGRSVFGRDQTAKRAISAAVTNDEPIPSFAEPLSPRTVGHLKSQDPHRLQNVKLGSPQPQPLTPELSRALLQSAEPLKLHSNVPVQPAPQGLPPTPPNLKRSLSSSPVTTAVAPKQTTGDEQGIKKSRPDDLPK